MTTTEKKNNRGSGRARRGKNFENDITRSFKQFERGEDIWWRRIPDFRTWYNLNKSLNKPRVPGDFEALYRGEFFMLEAKSTISKYFNMDWIKPHQKESLLRVSECGGHGIILFSRRGRPVKCRAIPIMEYLHLEALYVQLGRKSIDVSDMLTLGVELPRLSGMFNLDPLFKPGTGQKKLEDYNG